MNKIKYLYIILPHRGVAAGKSRLASVLDDTQRRALNTWLLERTLRIAMACTDMPQQCVVVSPCAQTLTLAQRAGADVLCESEAQQGLNAALAQAAAHAAARGAQMLLILPCDLLLLDAAALRGMLALYRDGVDRVIAPDRAGSGTNALLVDAATRDFAFGENSFARHMQLAASSNQRAVTYRHPGMVFDLDTVPDYLSWLEGAGEVPDFLRRVPAGHGIKTGYGVNSAQP